MAAATLEPGLLSRLHLGAGPTDRPTHRHAGAALAAPSETGTSPHRRLTFRSKSDGDSVAVETVGRYQEAGQEASFVASVDLYDFADGKVTRIVSFATEVRNPVGNESGR